MSKKKYKSDFCFVWKKCLDQIEEKKSKSRSIGLLDSEHICLKNYGVFKISTQVINLLWFIWLIFFVSHGTRLAVYDKKFM